MMTQLYRSFRKTIGWRHLAFAVIVLTMTFTEHLNFHVKHDSGWWSLHTVYSGVFGDAWHFFKNLVLLEIIVYGYVCTMLEEYADWMIMDIAIYAFIAWLCHDPFLHYVYPVFIL